MSKIFKFKIITKMNITKSSYLHLPPLDSSKNDSTAIATSAILSEWQIMKKYKENYGFYDFCKKQLDFATCSATSIQNQ